MSQVLQVTSRDNPALQRIRKLSEGNAYRKLGSVWLEGDHLARAALARGRAPLLALATEAAYIQHRDLLEAAPRVLLIPPELFKTVSGLESPAQMGFEIACDTDTRIAPQADTVVLDRLQDAGNVGTLLRSAAALGFRQVLAIKGTAALWAPKVLRAGMGAHFGLHLVEGLSVEDLAALELPLIATSSHAPALLHETKLPSPCAWVMGHEGQGVQTELMQRCALTVGIPQPGGEESLNVGVAAAICLYESARQRLTSKAP